MSSQEDISRETRAPGTYRAIWWILGFRLITYLLMFVLIFWTAASQETGQSDYQKAVIAGMEFDPETYGPEQVSQALAHHSVFLCIAVIEALLLWRRRLRIFRWVVGFEVLESLGSQSPRFFLLAIMFVLSLTSRIRDYCEPKPSDKDLSIADRTGEGS